MSGGGGSSILAAAWTEAMVRELGAELEGFSGTGAFKVLTKDVGEEAAAAGVEKAGARERGRGGEVEGQRGGGTAGSGVSEDEDRSGRKRVGGGGGNEAEEEQEVEEEEEESHASRVAAPTQVLGLASREGPGRAPEFTTCVSGI